MESETACAFTHRLHGIHPRQCKIIDALEYGVCTFPSRFSRGSLLSGTLQVVLISQRYNSVFAVIGQSFSIH